MQVGPHRSLSARPHCLPHRRRGAKQVSERERARIADRVVLQLDALDLHDTAAASKPKRCIFAKLFRAAAAAAQHRKRCPQLWLCLFSALRCNRSTGGAERTRAFAAQAIATCRAPATMNRSSLLVVGWAEWKVARCD
jgi:hypothetical protein